MDGRRQRIAFSRERGGLSHERISLLEMRGDGSHVRPLVRGPSGQYDSSPAFSPNGKHLVFIRRIQHPNTLISEVLLARSDGSHRRVVDRLRATAQKPHFLAGVTFGPGGSSLYLTTVRFVKRGGQVFVRPSLHSIDAGGGGETVIDAHGATPTFSPNGQRIEYVSDADRNGHTCYEECSFNKELYRANSDGSNAHRVSRTKADEESPDSASNGAYIVYSAERSDQSNRQLYSIPAHNDCAPQQLTNVRRGAFDPAWQPTGHPSSPGVCGVSAALGRAPRVKG